jgi:lipopolysaccharide transport system permease protein
MQRLAFLYWQWLKRDVTARYRGSIFGLLWPLLQPAIQIMVFTLIFFEFMQMRWPAAGSSAVSAGVSAAPTGALDYALNVFAGLCIFNFMAEILGRSPSCVLSQPNLVTKVKFPLWLLPAVTVGAALIHIVVGTVSIALITLFTQQGALGAQSANAPSFQTLFGLVLLWVPLLLPLLAYGLGVAYFIASVGVYVRDIGQVMPALSSLLMFLTPIFYPLSSVPDGLKSLFAMNPLAWGADITRAALLSGAPIDAAQWGWHMLVSLIFCAAAAWTFAKLQKGFADVL